MTKLEQIQEEKVKRFGNAFAMTQPPSNEMMEATRTLRKMLPLLITEVWNEAELSGKVQALHAMEDIYHKANDKADLMEMTNEALLPKANITSDK